MQPSRHFHLAFLAGRYSSVKQFSGRLLAHLHFAHAYQGDDFAQALTLVTDLQAGRRRKLPEALPQAFLTPTWTRFVRAAATADAPGGHRQAYELGVLTTLWEERLCSGTCTCPTRASTRPWKATCYRPANGRPCGPTPASNSTCPRSPSSGLRSASPSYRICCPR